MKEILEKIIEHQNLSIAEAYDLMNLIMEGKVEPVILSGILTGLRTKNESPEEIAGFAKAMREKSLKITPERNDAIDVCGTGGDNSGTFNISTAAAFVIAGAGVPVAKHGNRSISSRSGSADVLEYFGVDINMPVSKAEYSLNKAGITFLFAPIYHPAMKYAASVRKELKIRTIFNLLGPISNPALVKRQVVGTFSNSAALKLSQTAHHLDYNKVAFICNSDKYDELILENENEIFEYDDKIGIRKYKLNNSNVNYPIVKLETLMGGDTQENGKIILDVIENKNRNGAFHTICANAALALKYAGYSDSLPDCIYAAEESILSGKAYEKLKQLIQYSNS